MIGCEMKKIIMMQARMTCDTKRHQGTQGTMAEEIKPITINVVL